ncbi:hypothetical protein J3458_004466 [Metarhizium acridum]|uniref:uncharacterized protein n=1 Tax=Metarhizium acridum TaxID=92637 RepID=UPI001C6C042A|nr:hypothetical protein J3458_004466 [Metarhizium acridum]
MSYQFDSQTLFGSARLFVTRAKSPKVANVNKEVLAVFDEASKKYEKLARPLPADLTSQLIHGDLMGNILLVMKKEGHLELLT